MRLFALLLLAGLPAVALDPRFVWETLDTPHFEVHYHQGTYRYAQRVARAAELSYQRLVPLLDHVPDGRTHIVVQDDTDFANGSASPILYNLIHAYAPPPDARSTLADFDDNVYELISHEYTHILHLDTVLGLPQAVNDVFGKLWITNGGQPIWFIEGMATFAESEVSAAGRVRASEEDMVLRAEVLEGKLPRIDTLSNLPLEWPRGFGQYTVGSRFLSFIGNEYGLGALRDLSHDFGSRPVPFAMNFSAERVLGPTYLQLYDQFAAEELRRASRLQAQVGASGPTAIEPLTRLGEWVRTPRWSPDASTLYYTNAGPDRLAEIRAVRPDKCCGPPVPMTESTRPGDRHVGNLWSDGSGDSTLAVGPDGRVVYARAQVFQEFEILQDLYSVDPRTGDERRLSRGLRARSPDVSRDGNIAFVWRRSGGRTAIAELRPEGPRGLCEDPHAEPLAEQRPPVTAVPQEEIYPTRPYSPWETLRPHFWLPYAAADGYGTTVGALTAGFDAVDRHEYAATAWWSIYGKEPGFDLIYVNHSLYPDLTLEFTRDLGTPQAAGGLDAPGYYFERSIGGSITASFPFSEVERSQSLSLTYELENLAVDTNPLGVPTSPGLLAAATLTYSWSDVRRFVRSISSERGQRFALSLRLSDPALGSQFSFWQATTSASKFFALPWSTRGVPWHHALALRGSFGVSNGDLSNRHDFFLGGFQQGDLVRSVLNPAAGTPRLRGFARDSFHGTAYALGTAEYRFPLFDVETGAWTLPVYLRRLHAAVFADVGDAFTFSRHDFHLHTGAGAELRAEVVLGWILPTDLRFGCARGLESGPVAILDCYAALGGVF